MEATAAIQNFAAVDMLACRENGTGKAMGGENFLTLMFRQIFAPIDGSKEIFSGTTPDGSLLQGLEKELKENGLEAAMQMMAEMLTMVGENPMIGENSVVGENPMVGENPIFGENPVVGENPAGVAVLAEMKSSCVSSPMQFDQIRQLKAYCDEYAATEGNMYGVTQVESSGNPVGNQSGNEYARLETSTRNPIRIDDGLIAVSGENAVYAQVEQAKGGNFVGLSGESAPPKELGPEIENLLRADRHAISQAEAGADKAEELKKHLEASKHISVPNLQINEVKRDISAERAVLDGKMEFDLHDAVSQIRSEIQKNTFSEKNEFVIRLKPEGLGEITVKMVYEKSKISLSIITQSSQVEKMLSNEISDLRAMLRPLNAEVKEITSRTDPYFGEWQGERMFSGQQQNNYFERQMTRELGFSAKEREIFDAKEEMAGERVSKRLSVLDRYI